MATSEQTASSRRPRPDFGALQDVAFQQSGYFTTRQAAEVGYSPQALRKHLITGRIERIQHGIYRVSRFPASEREQLVVVWLWTDRQGVLSHETALAAHGLSDTLPNRIFVTLPDSWRGRRLRVPPVVVLHFAGVADADRTWMDAVPMTAVARTLADCLESDVRLDLVRQALGQAVQRGWLTAEQRGSLGDRLEAKEAGA
jgi:predicted transcriptional regulator of viral defense system